MKKDDVTQSVAAILRNLREKKGLSKNRMAEFVGVNKRTWYAWENGETAPNIVDFIHIFEECGESMLRPILELLYPDQYSNTEHDKRIQLQHFLNTAATDHQIDVLDYLIFGNHGSNYAPQSELFCAYNHLPMEQRFFAAEMVYQSFLICKFRNELLNEDAVMPDMKTWQAGLKASQRAAYKRLNSYTTITED